MCNKIALSFFVFLMTACSHADTQQTTRSDLCEALDLVMNSHSLAPYYHLDTFPDRLPIRILLESDEGGCSDLILFDMPVVFIEKNLQNLPDFFNVAVKYELEQVHVDVHFPAEGILGTFLLQKNKDAHLVISSQKIVEK